MKRDCIAHRPFDRAVPIRAGILTFHSPGASVFKKKGILGKASDYVNNSEIKECLALLLRISVEKIVNPNALEKTYKEEKFLWTWDSDQTSELESFLKIEAPGMCRHTRDQLMLTEDKRENARSHKGICTRSECSTLKVDDLLMTYLRSPLTSTGRHQRYMEIVKNFPIDAEYVLFDPDFQGLQGGKLICGAIHKSTLRYKGNSNGESMNMMTMLFTASSKLEAVKNAFRPLALAGQRGSTVRSFPLIYIASSDRDTLNEWWKAITLSLQGSTPGDRTNELKNIFSDKMTAEPGMKEIQNRLTEEQFRDTGIKNVKVYGDIRFENDAGKADETIIAESTSPASLEQLFEHIVQQKNTFAAGNSFDQFLFGGAANETKKKVELQVLVDPINSWGQVNDTYGLDQQTAYVRAITETKLDTDDWVQMLMPQPLKQINYVKKATDMFSTWWSGPTNETVSEADGNKLRRFFGLEKSYYVDYEENGKAKDFVVIWSSKRDRGFDGDNGKNVTKGGATIATIDQVVMKVERAEKTPGNGYTMSWFQDKLINQPKAAKELMNSEECKKFMELKSDIATVWNVDQANFYKQEMVADKLTIGTKDNDRLQILRYLNFLAQDSISTRYSYLQKSFGVFAALLKATVEVLEGTSNIVLISAGMKILTKLMEVGPYVQKDFARRSLLVNDATKAFVKLVEQSVLSNAADSTGLYIFKLAVTYMDSFIDGNMNSCISRVNLDAIEALKPILDEIKMKCRAGDLLTFSEVETSYSKLQKKWFFGYSVINLRKRERNLATLEELKTKTGAEKEIEQLRFPYCSNGQGKLAWNEAKYLFDKEVFVLANNHCIAPADFSTMEIEVPAKYMKATYVDTFRTTPVTEEDLGDEADVGDIGYFCTENIKAIRSKTEDQSIKAESLIKNIKGLLVALRDVTENPKSKITIKLVSNAEKLYGKNLVAKRPELGRTWAVSMLKDMDYGLQHIEKEFAGKELQLKELSVEKSLEAHHNMQLAI